MTTPEHLPLTSLDIAEDRKALLRKSFPEVFREDKIDFEALQRALGEWVDPGKERFGLNWPGKAACSKLIQQASVGTLLPMREQSVDFDSTENLIIEGDNLEVLKLLQKSYYGKVKMIYIDPPYNTGNEFIYPDNFHEGLQDYLKYSAQVDDEGRKQSSNAETGGRYHSNWLSMMYPRLFLARNLLREDGIVVVHIDEHELENLILMLNEIFGSENNLGTIAWDKKNPKGDSTGISYQHESIVVFSRNREQLSDSHELVRNKANADVMFEQAKKLWRQLGNTLLPQDLASVAKKYGINKEYFQDYEVEFTYQNILSTYADWISEQDNLSGGEAAYNKLDENGEIYRLVHMGWPNKKKAPDEYFIPLIHPKTGKPCPVPERGWRNPPETMKKYLDLGEIVFGEDETVQPQRKYLLRNNVTEGIPSVLRFGGSDDALFKELKLNFDNPKPYRFSADLITYFTNGTKDIVLDFFAGSGTTAHAVMEANRRDNGNRKFILVQLPEPTDNPAYPTIADITRERVRRVSAKLKAAQAAPDLLSDASDKVPPDLGFKAMRLSSSNFKVWDGRADQVADVGATLKLFAEHVLPGRTSEDILYELLLKTGFPLTTPLSSLTLAGKQVFRAAEGALLICLDHTLSLEVIEAMVALDPWLVLCLDAGFSGQDQLKANAMQTVRAHNRNRQSSMSLKVV